MDFSPAFIPLQKFTVGIPSERPSEDDVAVVAKYLGLDLPDVSLDDRVGLLSKELSSQNRYLSTHLDSDLIFEADQYQRSKFVREIVANNRINRSRRTRRTE